MHPAHVQLLNGERVPIENIVCQTPGGRKRWVESYMRFARSGGQSLDLHKEKLGKQAFTFRGSEYRNWVWEGKDWVVCVSKRGVELNVCPKMSMQNAWKTWREYLQTLGLRCNIKT